MRLWSNSFQDGGALAADHAFCAIDPATHVRLAANRNPHLAWDEVPGGTESLALFCFDPDAPSVGTDVNQEGRSVPHDLARVDFFHWSLIDLPRGLKTIADGALSDGVTARGKSGPAASLPVPGGIAQPLRQGINDYTGWFAGDAEMAGDYYGYDGPCPPWNDLRLHHYIFRLYALDVARLDLPARFSGQDAMAAIQGHILDEAQTVGVYSLQPDVARTLTR